MTDIEKSKALFESGEYTCVLVKSETIYKSALSGISPMVGFIKNRVDLYGFLASRYR